MAYSLIEAARRMLDKTGGHSARRLGKLALGPPGSCLQAKLFHSSQSSCSAVAARAQSVAAHNRARGARADTALLRPNADPGSWAFSPEWMGVSELAKCRNDANVFALSPAKGARVLRLAVWRVGSQSWRGRLQCTIQTRKWTGEDLLLHTEQTSMLVHARAMADIVVARDTAL